MKERQLYRTGVVRGIQYTCEFCTDHIDPTKTEEILQKVTRIISEALVNKNAPSGTGIPSGANKNYSM